jgi:hypothetical protein
MLAKRTYKNQITIPKIIMKGLDGIEYFDVRTENSEIVLRPVLLQSREKELENIRKKVEALGVTEKEVESAVHWARKRV